MWWRLYSRELVETPPWRSWPYRCILINSISRLLSCDKWDHNWSCMLFKTNTIHSYLMTYVHVCIMLYIHLYKYRQSVFCTLSTASIELHSGDVQPNHAQYRVIWGLGDCAYLIFTWSVQSRDLLSTFRVVGISYKHMWPVNIAPFSMCRPIVCKTGEVSCPLYTRVWVPLGWGGWVYTCVLNTCNIIILYSILEWVNNKRIACDMFWLLGVRCLGSNSCLSKFYLYLFPLYSISTHSKLQTTGEVNETLSFPTLFSLTLTARIL